MALKNVVKSDFKAILAESGGAELTFSTGETVFCAVGECSFSNDYEPGASVATRMFSATFLRDAVSELPVAGARAVIDGKHVRIESVRHAFSAELVSIDFSEV